MLDSIKRWMGTAPVQIPGWNDLSAWARQRQWTLRAVREPEGFVVDGRAGSTAWRLEWGPSQRSYIAGNELRLRAELEVPRELQALVLDRVLMESMERAVFDEYVEDVQTRIDTGTPAEMRWLVMHPKLSGTELKALRDDCSALGNSKPWLQQWLDGPLGPALAQRAQARDQALVLMVARRRLSLRTALADPAPAALQAWHALFDCALQQARRVNIDFAEPEAPNTQPSLFPPSTLRAPAQASS